MSHSQLAAVLGRVPSGLFVLTIRDDDEETGMLVSWVMQAGFKPPMVTVALNRERHIAEWVADGATFALSMLAENQKQAVARFGHGFEPGEPAFDGFKISRTSNGLPVLADAIGYLECRAKTHFDSADHRIFLADVLDGQLLAEGQPYVHIRKNGLRY